MDKVITYNFGEDFIGRLAEYIEKHFYRQGQDVSRLAVVFGGKRPSLFLKRELARRIKGSYFPPRFFSVDNFIQKIVSLQNDFRMVSSMDAAFIIYNAAKEKARGILGSRKEFSHFLPWAKEIVDFIDELDLEGIAEKNLKEIEMSATIGYEIPENLNVLLEHITALREFYHGYLKQHNLFSRGLLYLSAAKIAAETDLDEFDTILFCNFYYLHKTEEEIIRSFYERGKAVLFFQKDRRPSDVFKRLSKVFAAAIEPGGKEASVPEAKIYKGFDSHSQIGLVRQILKEEILKRNKDLHGCVILLSQPANLIPLLSEISGEVQEFNVSMGYPLKRSALFTLFQYIFKAQSSRKDGKYYTCDYLKVLLHPLIKNLLIGKEASITRILCHKVQEALLGMSKTELSGSLFVVLDQLEASQEIYRVAADTLVSIDASSQIQELAAILSSLHEIAFRIWENVGTFAELAICLEKFSANLLDKSAIGNYPLDTKIIEKIYDIQDELKNAQFRHQPFTQEEIFRIFEATWEDEKVAFSGSPLKGLQILELFETRSLTFPEVIVMDANESVLPSLRAYEPLIPRQAMESLGLQRLKQEEQIQRYHFMRLISGAKNVYFVFDDNPEKEKSRFIEEFIWQRQKTTRSFDVLPQVHAKFRVSALTHEKTGVKKNAGVIAYLRDDFIYSPSSIDAYMQCPLRFYYQYVLRLKEKEDLLATPEASDIGNFIHHLLDQSFRVFLDKKPVIDAAFEKSFFEEFNQRFERELYKRMGAEAFMVRDIMEYRLKRFLEHERARNVKKIIGLEEERTDTIRVAMKELAFKYRIDRIDLLADDSLLIIDYKTGSSPVSPGGLAALTNIAFSRQAVKNTLHSFQLPLYYYFVKRRYKDVPLNAALYNLRQIEFSEFIKRREKESAPEVASSCMKALEEMLKEIINPDVDFQADSSDERSCAYCSFFSLCR